MGVEGGNFSPALSGRSRSRNACIPLLYTPEAIEARTVAPLVLVPAGK
jgi:hypothetical protein